MMKKTKSRSLKRKSYLGNAIRIGGRFINYKMGIYGAIFLGFVVFVINFRLTAEWGPSMTASLKQGSYTFLFGGVIMKFCEILAIKIKQQFLAIGLAIILPAVIAVSLTFGLHNLRGTPRPIASTIPTLLIIPATAVVAVKKRKSINNAFSSVE